MGGKDGDSTRACPKPPATNQYTLQPTLFRKTSMLSLPLAPTVGSSCLRLFPPWSLRPLPFSTLRTYPATSSVQPSWTKTYISPLIKWETLGNPSPPRGFQHVRSRKG